MLRGLRLSIDDLIMEELMIKASAEVSTEEHSTTEDSTGDSTEHSTKDLTNKSRILSYSVKGFGDNVMQLLNEISKECLPSWNRRA